MFFGSYLVNKKVISEDQLIDVLVIQLKEQPSLLDILRADCGVDSKRLIELLNIQVKDGKDLYQVLKESSDISPEILAKATDIIKEKRPTLGQLLLDSGILSADEINSQLENFMSESSKPIVVEDIAPQSTAVQTQEDESSDVVSDAAVETLREQVEAGLMDPSVLDSFGDKKAEEEKANPEVSADTSVSVETETQALTNTSLVPGLLPATKIVELSGLLKQCKELADNPQEKDKILQNLDLVAKTAHQVAGGAKLINAPLLEDCFSSLELAIQKVGESSKLSDMSFWDDLYDFYLMAVAVKNTIEANGNEDEYTKDETNNNKLISIKNKLIQHFS